MSFSVNIPIQSIIISLYIPKIKPLDKIDLTTKRTSNSSTESVASWKCWISEAIFGGGQGE